jgi:D-sedoheptulose 7-phosphate isomerase
VGEAQIARVADHLQANIQLLACLAEDREFLQTVVAMGQCISQALAEGGKILIAGNGGSAADAQHIAAEFVGRFSFDRRPLAALALTTDSSALTGIGNDYGFADIFERQLQALAKPGDAFLAMSTSGRSANVLAALNAASRLGLRRLGFTGANGAMMNDLCELCVVVPSNDTALIQQIHLAVGHALCAQVERELCGGDPA